MMLHMLSFREQIHASTKENTKYCVCVHSLIYFIPLWLWLNTRERPTVMHSVTCSFITVNKRAVFYLESVLLLHPDLFTRQFSFFFDGKRMHVSFREILLTLCRIAYFDSPTATTRSCDVLCLYILMSTHPSSAQLRQTHSWHVSELAERAFFFLFCSAWRLIRQPFKTTSLLLYMRLRAKAP